MDASGWVSAIAAFAGGLVGAALSAWVALRGQRQTEREEWYRRFLAAVDQLTSPSPERHTIGETMLTELVDSDLGTPEERALARRVLRGQLEPDVQQVEADVQRAQAPLRSIALDRVTVEEDNVDEPRDQEGPP
ncbi:hypothetical protein PZ938_03445 [Luteipulveratus sp. YIM 133132]|uniref:Uncharacterized protein n=1 Tax=Luteipulveratus flavus TaxID=3031728 RepID=A0ABT6C420_9MICO|nr:MULTISPECIES: hypothetical protein [unclassified Luteipulveratus]MDE9364649.1 hypothetical protein [Luteipulveratus sp. YIM 133132]MDF8262809.1 hypothetical protein [Luteipulveratus sp. YIM 133296]